MSGRRVRGWCGIATIMLVTFGGIAFVLLTHSTVGGVLVLILQAIVHRATVRAMENT